MYGRGTPKSPQTVVGVPKKELPGDVIAPMRNFAAESKVNKAAGDGKIIREISPKPFVDRLALPNGGDVLPADNNTHLALAEDGVIQLDRGEVYVDQSEAPRRQASVATGIGSVITYQSRCYVRLARSMPRNVLSVVVLDGRVEVRNSQGKEWGEAGDTIIAEEGIPPLKDALAPPIDFPATLSAPTSLAPLLDRKMADALAGKSKALAEHQQAAEKAKRALALARTDQERTAVIDAYRKEIDQANKSVRNSVASFQRSLQTPFGIIASALSGANSPAEKARQAVVNAQDGWQKAVRTRNDSLREAILAGEAMSPERRHELDAAVDLARQAIKTASDAWFEVLMKRPAKKAVAK